MQTLPESASSEYLKTYLKNLHKTTLDGVSANIAYYQVEEGIAPHTLRKVDAILNATNIEDAKTLSVKASESGFMYCMGMWAEGKARGPRTKEFIEKEIKRELSFVSRFEDKGLKIAAASHKKRVQELRSELQILKERLI